MKLIIVIGMCLLLTGCAIHYHNEKRIEGKGKDIKTKIGVVESTKAYYMSTLDVWIPCKPASL